MRPAPGDAPGAIDPGALDWYRDAVIYQTHVRVFSDSNNDGVGDFGGLTQRLDYFADLGVTAIWLLPFYPSPLRDDGYDIADYRAVHPAYGDMRSFKRFLAAAHGRGIRVITELVINHTSDQHRWFQRARNAPAGSKWRDFYVWSDDPERYGDARVIFSDFETSNWMWDPVAQAYFWHRFYSHQPDLNYDNPAVIEAIFGVLDFWLDLGVDGLRLDAVPYLFEREGTNCENLPETHALLKRIRAHIDERYPGRMLLAEANQWPEDAVAYFGDGDECHMNFHFPVMPRLFMALSMEQRTPIVDIMEQTPEPPEGGQWAMFLRNHDELTLEMVTDEERDRMLRAYASDAEMRINLGIRRRLAPLLDNDRRKIELLNALLFSLPGTPVVYYGDEIGMGDNVYLGDRDGVRTPMQWSADRNGGFSSANPHRLYLPLITELGYHYESVNVETQAANPASLLAWTRQLIGLRKRHRVLGRGSTTFLDPENPHVLAFVRELDGENPLVCVANLSRLAQYVEIDLRDFAGCTPVEVFGQSRFAAAGERPYPLSLAPYGFFWLSLMSGATAGTVTEPGDVTHLSGTWEEVLRRWAPLGRALARWLPEQRWYAGKDGTVRDLTVDGAVEMEDGLAIVLVRVSFNRGADHVYVVPIASVSAARSGEPEPLAATALIATLDGGAVLVDAMADPRAAGRLARGALRRITRRGRDVTAYGKPRRTKLSEIGTDPRDVHVMSVEQSNSSVVLDSAVIAKLIRRFDPGENHDVTIPLQLRRAGFAHAPGLVGTLEVQRGGDADSASVVIAHDAVTNEGDLWTWCQDVLARDIERFITDPERTGSETTDAGMTAVLGLLARRTAELHQALATPAPGFEPERFSLLSQRSILQTMRSGLRDTQRALRAASRSGGATDDGDVAELAALVIDRGDELLERFEELRTRRLDAVRIQVHGDLHLGQVLWTGHDVVFIDFEGEPGHSITERSIKRTPLVDVAGLWRSLDYAGRVALAAAGERGWTDGTSGDDLKAWRRRWTAEAQDVLWDLYCERLAANDGPPLVPADEDDALLLRDANILIKSLYEVRYELEQRPRWVAWPLAGVAEMLEQPS